MSRKLYIVMAVSVVGMMLASSALAAGKKAIATVAIPPAPELYAVEPQPLAVSQCGQCHTSQFRAIRSDGARHRFDCQKCHSTFHAFNPKKGGWDALMPKCSGCHEQPHGPAVTDCLGCHANPHAPRKVAMDARLINACPTCHAGPKEQLVQFPSKHSTLGCQRCHTAHGFKPTCFTCHKPHTADQTAAGCTTCHQVHKPKQVTWGTDAAPAVCGSCHARVYGKWSTSPSRHGKLSCVTCHKDRHRFVPKCTDCHKGIHPQGILQHYPNCLTCHLDVHNPPVSSRK